MARFHHTEGVCLRRIPYANTSQVASFLTPDAGRVSVIAKGVTRAPKRGIRTGFDLLGRYEIIYIARRPGSLQNLTYRWLRESFRGLRRAPERVLCGYYAAELMQNFVAEGEPCPELYQLVVGALRSFAAGRLLGVNVLRLEIGALRQHGSCPEFDACASCGGPLPPRGAVLFSAAAGGPLCKDCEAAGTDRRERTMTVRRNLLEAAGALAAAPPQEESPDLGLKPRHILAASSMLRFAMRDQLGRELRMWKYLERRELSRSLQRTRRRAGLGSA